jgi:OmpR-family two-component system manganese-sensing response regulator
VNEFSAAMAKILYVEDDATQASNIKACLELEGHNVEIASDGADALQLCQNFEFDVILLDWQLPSYTGIEICRQYRKMGGKSWVIFLTGQGNVVNKETGLDAGADDYLVKPVELREVAARVRRALRRTKSNFQMELKIGDVALDQQNRLVTVDNCSLRLMPKEAALLEYLMRNPNEILSSKRLLSAVWPSGKGGSEGAVRTFMGSLRKKLQSIGKDDFIKTVLGSGYIIEVDQE